ncbi:CHAT domain-containing protein OS=Streptomyces antimycoticus OX=68175 GN=SANT12839_010090 PE=4 SV=1 [Streptomyces antimycoticus]
MHSRDLAALRDRAEHAAADALAWIAPPPPDGPAAKGSSDGMDTADPSGGAGSDGSSHSPAAGRTSDGIRSPADADPASLDRFIAELDQLEAALAAAVPDGDALLCTVRARLGGLYAERYRHHPTDDDRSRGLRVLRAARARGALDPSDERASTLHLVRLLLTPGMTAGWDGTLPRLLESFDVGRQVVVGEPGLTADLTELRGLLTDLLPTLPEDVAEPLSWAAEALERVPAAARSGDFEQMATLAAQLARAPAVRRVRRGMDAHAAAQRHGPALEELSAGRARPSAPPYWTRSAPGRRTAVVKRAGAGRRRGGTAMRAAMSRMAHGVRTGDADRLAEAAELIGTAAGTGSGRVDWMAGVISPGLLTAANILGGNLTDRDQARARLDALFGPACRGIRIRTRDRPRGGGYRLCSRSMHLQLRLNEALDERDAETVEELLDELLDLLEEASEYSEWQFLVLFLLGQAQLSLATLDGGIPALRAGVAYFEEAANHPRLPTFARPLMDAQCAPLLALFSMIEPDPVRVSEAVTRARPGPGRPRLDPDQRVWIRQGIGMALPPPT